SCWSSIALAMGSVIAVIPILVILPLLGNHHGINVAINPHTAASIAQLPKWLHAIVVAGILE
ncbi:hypothetical protein, partial [Escherichia coli]|uniref:hypothetical protein n=1 Tax=Escherichia coli TaxID=562 RepID=UPI00195414C3